MAREGGNERSSFLLFLVARLVSELHETMYNIQNFGLVVLLFTFNYENKRARNNVLDSAKLEGRLEGEEKNDFLSNTTDLLKGYILILPMQYILLCQVTSTS